MYIFLFSFCLLASRPLSSEALKDGLGQITEAAANGDISKRSDFPRGAVYAIKFIETLEGLDNSAYYQDDFPYTGTIFSSSIFNPQRRFYSIPSLIVLTIDETGIFQAALDQMPTGDETRIIDNAADNFAPGPVR